MNEFFDMLPYGLLKHIMKYIFIVHLNVTVGLTEDAILILSFILQKDVDPTVDQEKSKWRSWQER